MLKFISVDVKADTKINLSFLAYSYSKSKPEKSSLLDFFENNLRIEK